MDFSSIIFIAGIVLLVVLFVGWPLSSPARVSRDHVDPVLSGLLAEHDHILDSLADLDNDHGMGKLDPGDYQSQRGILVRQGAELLRRLESFQEAPPSKATPVKKRATKTSAADPLEAMIAARRTSLEQGVGTFCGNCGEPLLPGDKFCSHCGAKVK